jgi:hypothetical protein
MRWKQFATAPTGNVVVAKNRLPSSDSKDNPMLFFALSARVKLESGDQNFDLRTRRMRKLSNI